MASRTKMSLMMHILLLMVHLWSSSLGQLSQVSNAMPMASTSFAKNTAFNTMATAARGYNAMQTGSYYSYPMDPQYWTGQMTHYSPVLANQYPYYDPYSQMYPAMHGFGQLGSYYGQYPAFDPMYWSNSVPPMYIPPSYPAMPVYNPMYHPMPMYNPMYHQGMGPYQYYPQHGYPYAMAPYQKGFFGGTGKGMTTLLGAALVGLVAGSLVQRG